MFTIYNNINIKDANKKIMKTMLFGLKDIKKKNSM